jgi:hypothetical protein
VKAAVAAQPVLSTMEEIGRELAKGKAENVLIELDGKAQRLSNLNKMYFPEAGFTKRDLLAHYFRVADFLLPLLRNRPLVLNRFPNGIHGKSFYQKDAAEETPAWVDTVGIRSEERKRGFWAGRARSGYGPGWQWGRLLRAPLPSALRSALADRPCRVLG